MEEVFLPDGTVDMRLLMMSLWRNRTNAKFTAELCQRLSCLTISNPTLDQVEFFLPQLAHMVIHFDKELPIEDMEQFVLLLCQSSVHFALQFFWITYAALDENRPKRNGNPRTFARCAQLLLALEQCLVYGSPVVREVSELFTKNSISRTEMEQLLMADRRFFAAQSSMESSDIAIDYSATEGWLFKKGGGTSKMGRRNWTLRWCRIEKRMLLVFSSPEEDHARTSIALDRAVVRVVENPRHRFYFEINHPFSDTTFKFAAQSQEDLVTWVHMLNKAAAAPEPPVATTSLSPGRSLARMSWGMRSFILQSANGCFASDKDGGEASLPGESESSSQVRSASPPASPKARAASPPPSPCHRMSGVQPRAESENPLFIPNVPVVSCSSVCSSEAGDATPAAGDEEMDLSLPLEQRRRYEFFTSMINFIKAITDISEALRLVEPSKRKVLLRPRLEDLQIPANAYIPLCKSTDPYCRVMSVFSTEGRVFSTNERAPCLLYFDTEENIAGCDVSQALFGYLYGRSEILEDGLAHGDPTRPLSTPMDADNDDSQFLSPFLRQLLATPERKSRVEKIFGELGAAASERLRGLSKSKNGARWRLTTLISKSHDDLRQEVLVMQLISYIQHVFRLEDLPLQLHPYRILSTGATTGLIEVVKNAVSFDGLKKTQGYKNLRHLFEHMFGGKVEGESEGEGAELLQHATQNFIQSLAAYSIVCYVLSIKDRHNGNIMLDAEGHIIHIDFGFFLGRAPGGSFSFETAPFKLTAEMVDVMGGRHSTGFKTFSELCVKGALAIRKHAETIFTLAEVMSFHSQLPCFIGGTSTPLMGLRERLFLNMTDDKVEAAITSMIERAYDHFGTTKYDQFQVLSNGIAK